MRRSTVKGILAVGSMMVLLAASGCATSGEVSAARADAKQALQVANEANAKATAAASDAAAARAAADAAAAEARAASEKADRIFQRSLHK